MTLQPFDILLWKVSPSASLIERAIGWAEARLGDQQGAAFYHVGFVSGSSKTFYQSKPPKIQLTPVPDPLPPYIVPYRLIAPPTPAQLTMIFAYANSRLGRPYDFLGVLTAGYVEVGGLEFCSKYTNDSGAAAQIVLSSKIQPTPDDIANSPLIAPII